MSVKALIASTLAVWLLIAVGLTVAAHEGHLNHHSAAVAGNPPRIRYVDQSWYHDAVRHARTVWNGIRDQANTWDPLISRKQDGQTRTLLIRNVDTTAAYIGIFKCSSPCTDVSRDNPRIFLSTCWLGRPSAGGKDPAARCAEKRDLVAADENRTVAHEFGHALCLAHRFDRNDVLMDPSPTNVDGNANGPDPQGPTEFPNGDEDHYDLGWDQAQYGCALNP